MWAGCFLSGISGWLCTAERAIRGQGLDWVYPRTCLRCGRFLQDSAGYACEDCRADYAFIAEPVCKLCGSPHLTPLLGGRLCSNCVERKPAFASARSLFTYAGTGARLIHALKYEHGSWVEDEIVKLVRDVEWLEGFLSGGTLVPVPLHRRKLRRRGYNQAMVVARALCRADSSLRIWNGLTRTRDTPSQTDLSRRERRLNVSGAFCAQEPAPRDQRLVLIDDVLTTGATLGEAALALRKAGASWISAFTLAHG
jgi:ComF family protein